MVSFLGFECLFGGRLVGAIELCCLCVMVCLSACFDRFCSFTFKCIGFGDCLCLSSRCLSCVCGLDLYCYVCGLLDLPMGYCGLFSFFCFDLVCFRLWL